MGALFLIVTFLKQQVFANTPRPSLYLQSYELSKRVGWNLYNNNSFPSGHTTAAFTLFCLFAFQFSHRAIAATCVLLAALTGVSRIYLLQHFAIDVLAGSLLGYIIAATTQLIVQHRNNAQQANP